MSDDTPAPGANTLNQQWAAVRAAYERAELAYRPIRANFTRIERRHFSFVKECGAAPHGETAQRQIEMEAAAADERRYGNALHAAARAILGTPAPDLASVIYKIGLTCDLDWDEQARSSIIADLNRLRTARRRLQAVMNDVRESAGIEVADDSINGPNASERPCLTDEEQRRYVEALETLPLLTRAVFLLASRDNFPYPEIAFRCGISVQEVQVRVVDALVAVGRDVRGRRTVVGRIRRALLPWRDAWAAARMRESDRRLAPWLSPENRPGRRGALDWMAWAFEQVLR